MLSINVVPNDENCRVCAFPIRLHTPVGHDGKLIECPFHQNPDPITWEMATSDYI